MNEVLKKLQLFSLPVLLFLFVHIKAQSLDFIKLPPGFKIEFFAKNVDNARSMTYGGDGIYYVGSRGAGNVYAVVDKNHDNRAEKVVTIAKGLNMPSGVVYRNGDLYVAEVHQILKFDNINKTYEGEPKPSILPIKYPSEKHHGWKYIDFGPDGKLYVPVGAPCNVCEKDESIFGSITRLDLASNKREIYASGVRNSVGFDWHPLTGELWFTDNGRDNMGDNMPPDELNHAPKSGMHFGFPYCHGGVYPDPEFSDGHPCANYTSPARQLGPHVASLGMKFYSGKMFPKKYVNQIFIAEHGSWNRSTPIGYRITMATLEDNTVVNYSIFAEGWLQNDGKVLGRPNALLILEDGSMLVSDDKRGCIYRISYSP